MNPFVSISMITYNHEHFIGKAIESVLSQKTTFTFELVIGEDCSTDNTREVCEKYAKEHPEIIRLLPSEKNIGAQPNFVRTYTSCKGTYIAILEGDDYWTSPDKLQKQVDFLEKNPEFSFSTHSAVVLDQNGNRSSYQFARTKSVNTFEDIVKKHFIPTCSLVFRKASFQIQDWLTDPKLLCGDKPMEMILAHHGKCYHFQEDMAVYLKHSGGLTRGLDYNKIKKKSISTIFLYENIDRYTNGQYDVLDKKLAAVYMRHAVVLLKEKNISASLKYAMKSFSKDPVLLLRRAIGKIIKPVSH